MTMRVIFLAFVLTASLASAMFCEPMAGLTKDVVARLPEDARGRVQGLPQLFDAMVKGTASEDEMLKLVNVFTRHGVPHLKLPEEALARIHVPDRPRADQPLKDSHFKRYGTEGEPIFAYPLSGQPGKPGGVYIYTPGEKVGPTDFAKFLGPPHIHDQVAHISVVTQGEGIFYLQTQTPDGPRLLSIPVSRGSVVLIPPNAVHTFWAGQKGNFDVASFTTKVIPTNSSDFLKLTPQDELNQMPVLDYDDYLRTRFPRRAAATAGN